MFRGATFFLVVVVVFVLGSWVWVLWGRAGAQQAARDQRRQADLQLILDRLQAYAAANRTIPLIDAQWQQLGTASDGCQLQTSHCQVSQPSCLNLNLLTGRRDLTLPSDVQLGTVARTGYAIRWDEQTQVASVVACGAEQAASIAAQRSLATELYPVQPVGRSSR